MLHHKMGALTVWIFVLVGCAAPPSDSGDEDRQATEVEIAKFAEAFWDAWRDGNAGLDRAMAFLDDHPEFTYAAQGTVWRSVSHVTETFQSAFEMVQSQTIEIQGTEITVASQDFAHLTQWGVYAIIDVEGVNSEMRPFTFSGLLVRTDSGWRVRSAHVSEPCVAAPAPADP